jgi:hypothetical protein
LRQGPVILVLLAAIAILSGAFLALRMGTREETTAPAPPAPPPTEVAPPEAVEPPPPVERRELAIEGRVFSGGSPVAGVAVLSGEESAVTAADGSFAFPPAARGRTAGVGIREADREVLSMDGLLVGDAAAAEAESAGTLESSLLPGQPGRLRWTIHIPAAGSRTPPREWIRLDAVVAEEWGNGVRVRVRGSSRLPDGAHVSASLYFDGFRLIADMRPAEVAGGTFTATLFSPPGVRFYSGTYEVSASFSSVLELPSAKAAWAAERPGEDWEALIVPDAALSVFIGDPAEARSEDEEVATYYSKAAGEAKALRQVLRSRVRALHLLARAAGDVVAWKAKVPARDGWTHEDLATGDGRIDVAKWRTFLDVFWRPQVKALLDAHAARGEEKYPEAGRLLAAVLGTLLEESYAMSRFQVYSDFDLEPDERDFYPDEENAGDLVQMQRVVEGGLEALERYQRLVD